MNKETLSLIYTFPHYPPQHTHYYITPAISPEGGRPWPAGVNPE